MAADHADQKMKAGSACKSAVSVSEPAKIPKTATGAIGDLMSGLKKRNQVDMLDRRTIEKKGRRRLDFKNARMLPATEAERLRLERLAKATGKAHGAETYFGFLDAARRVAGTGSLGIVRYVLLLEGTGSPDGNVLLDLKAATPSSLAAATRLAQPDWSDEAARVVTVQRRSQAISPAQLSAVTFDSLPFVLKELQPSADRLNLAHIARDHAVLADAFRSMASLCAWAQLRSSGRDGSATADALIAFAQDQRGFAAQLVTTARELADVTTGDYMNFCEGFDATMAPKAGKTATA